MATFEERLTKLRTKAGVSQQAIGDALNVSRWAVHNYEAGKNRPDFDGLIALADYFNVSLDYLVAPTSKRRKTARRRRNPGSRGGPCGRPQSGAGPALLELQSVKHSNRYL